MIQWSRISELRDEVGHDDFAEVVDLFLEEANEVLERLRNGPGPGDLERQLHFLKGSAMTLGFAHFSQLCQQGECKSASGQADDVDLAEILAAFETSCAAFHSQLAERLAE